MRIWFQEWQNTRLRREHIVQDESDLNRTKKIFNAIEAMSKAFDLGQPIWLEANIREFKRFAKVRFTKDNFLEDVSFDYIEMSVLEED